MNARDIMTPEPVTIGEKATIDDALRIMAENEIRHLPVVRGDEVVGIVSDRDVRGLGLSLVQDVASLDSLRARLRTRVTELMTGGVVTVAPDSEMSEVIDLLLEEKLSAVPVVERDSGALVGIVSYLDVLRAVQGQVE